MKNEQRQYFFSRKDMGGYPDWKVIEELRRANENMGNNAPKERLAINERRHRLDLMKAAELAIYNAIQEIEKLGADLRLTDAVILMSQAKDKVSDYLDELGQ